MKFRQPRGPAEPVIRCVGVARRYVGAAETVVALDDVTIAVAPGEFVCVQGPSGSGKSTLLNVIAGLDSPDDGQVEVLGTRTDGLGEEERAAFRLENIGVVFQDDNLISEFTALENVMLPLEARGMAGARGAALESLESLGVGALGNRLPAEMSGGQRQRIGIARAIVGGRRLLVADEPTGALDSRNSRALFEAVAELCRSGNSAIVATHDPLAQEFASRVVEMIDGRIV